MKTVPAALVDEVWGRVNSFTPDRARALAQRMQEEQPFIMVYLLAAEESTLEEEERGTWLILGATAWQVLSEGGTSLRRVTDVELEAAEDANVRALEALEEDSEMKSMNAMQQMIATYNQMPLLGAVVEALMDGHEDAPELAPDHLGLGFIHLKTVIDCLDQ
jgi:hypothetical protein